MKLNIGWSKAMSTEGKSRMKRSWLGRVVKDGLGIVVQDED
jgi:hypothetical protein